MSDVVDLRAAVRALATPQELAQLRPAAYEFAFSQPASSLIKRKRVRLPDHGDFIVTSINFNSETEVSHGVVSMRVLVDDVAGEPPRTISDGDIPIRVMPIFGDNNIGDCLPAPIYVRNGKAVIIEIVVVSAIETGSVALVEGFHAPSSLAARCRETLGELFILALSLTAGDDTSTEWEVPDGEHLVLKTMRQAGADAATTATGVHVDIAGAALWPLGFTDFFSALSSVAGFTTPQPEMALAPGDIIAVTPDTVSDDVVLAFFFSRE